MEDIAKVIRVLLLLALGGIFAVAGIPKAINPAAFAVSIDHYHLLPWRGAAALALYLPWLEILCAAALTTKKFRLGSLCVMLGLMLIFLPALISAAARGLDISCGCFGSGLDARTLAGAITRDIAILAALVFLLWRECLGATVD
jgi:uncharacterized membrane protein